MNPKSPSSTGNSQATPAFQPPQPAQKKFSTDSTQLLNLAVKHHQTGNLREAINFLLHT